MNELLSDTGALKSHCHQRSRKAHAGVMDQVLVNFPLHSIPERDRLQDSTHLQQKGVQLSASHSHYKMCLRQCSTVGCGKEPRCAVLWHHTISYHPSQVPQFDTATTHLPSLHSTDALSVAEHEGQGRVPPSAKTVLRSGSTVTRLQVLVLFGHAHMYQSLLLWSLEES